MSDVKQNRGLTRRAFSSRMLSAAMLSRSAWGELAKTHSGASFGYAYVGSPQAVHVFKVSDSVWRQEQQIPAEEPIHLERHPSLPILYVVHRVGYWDHRARGAVSTYSTHDGLLCLEDTRPLSLSATLPRHGAVSHDGRYLAVAAEGGGIYNLFPIGPEGALQSAAGIFKDLGVAHAGNPRSAAPQHLAWHADGRTLLAVDKGNGHMASFKTGVEGMERVARLRVHQGAGPSQLAISQDGRFVYSVDAEDGSIEILGFDSATKRFTDHIETISQPASGPVAMAVHSKENLLITVGAEGEPSTITAWRMDASSGRLRLLDRTSVAEGQRAISFAQGRDRLFGVAASSGAITEWGFDQSTGRFSAPLQVAKIDGAYSISVSLKHRGEG